MTSYHLFREAEVFEADAVEDATADEPPPSTVAYVYYGTIESNAPEQAIKQAVAAARGKGRFYATPTRSWKGLEVESKVVLGAKQLDFVAELEAEADAEMAQPIEPPIEPPVEEAPIEEPPDLPEPSANDLAEEKEDVPF